MSSKKERAQEVISELTESLMQSAPPMLKTMFPLLSMQFLPSFDHVPEEEIDCLIDHIRDRLDYIESGVGMED